MPTIAHLDMDAFFASVAVRDRPELSGQPVVISRDGPRSVVAAASYPARRYGVRSAMPLARARRLCPDLVVVPSDMDRYREVSAAVMGLLGGYSERVEVAGLDEAYLDLTGSPAPRARARALKAEVRARTGLTCTVGMGPSKLIAKIASARGKPDGLCHLTAEGFREAVGGSAVGILPGIGPKTAARLEAGGITTVDRLAASDPDRLASLLGPGAARLIDLARGVDDRELEPERPRKSESRERTFDEDVTDPAELDGVIARLAAELMPALEADGLGGRTATVKVRFSSFLTRTRSRTMPRPIGSHSELARIGGELLRELLASNRAPVRLVGIAVGSLEPSGPVADRELALF